MRTSPRSHDVRVVLPDGQVRWVRVRARRHPDDRGAPKQLSGIFVDITEQKAAEAEAALQRQEVAHLMRVSVLGELSGAIAHEINQPLTAIQSNAETGLDLLAEKSPDLAEIRDVSPGHRSRQPPSQRGHSAAAQPAEERRDGHPNRSTSMIWSIQRLRCSIAS